MDLGDLKRGVENKIFQSEIASGFGEPGGTHPPKIAKTSPLGLCYVCKHDPNTKTIFFLATRFRATR